MVCRSRPSGQRASRTRTACSPAGEVCVCEVDGAAASENEGLWGASKDKLTRVVKGESP